MSQTLKLRERQPHAEPPIVITVLGARSGTSALAGTLGLLGCTLPKKIMAANHGNTKGYFEPQDLADEHDAVLASVDSSWNDWRPFPQAWLSSEDAKAARYAIAAIYRANYGETPLAVLKEPRMCRILPLWFDIFQALGVRPVFCFIDRNPLEVAQSLQKRDGSTIEQGLRYYIRNHLDAERDTRGQRRAFTSYEGLLSNWRVASDQLDISLRPTREQEAEIDDFLEYDMRHQKAPQEAIENDELSRIAFGIHESYAALSRGEPQTSIRETLDKLRIEFDVLT
jgi:hypothetical protein